MLAEDKLIEILAAEGVDFTVSLPCDRIKRLIAMVPRKFFHVPLTREEEGVGICAGASLAGKRPAMFIQNSGVGNMINALLSLTGFYSLPLAIFASHRGLYKEKIAAQKPMGEKLPGILRGAGIGFTQVEKIKDLALIPGRLERVYRENKIHAFLLSPALWEAAGADKNAWRPVFDFGRRPKAVMPRGARGAHGKVKPRLTRYEILSAVWPALESKAVVCNLGFPARELYQIGHRPSNFYMLGSMGMATPLGLGVALATKKEVVVIDGDGSLLMNPGTLATAACLSPENLTVFAVDNGAYGSTGNQPTLAARCIDLEEAARGLGFRYTVKAAGKRDLLRSLEMKEGANAPSAHSALSGPLFIHALALPGNNLPGDGQAPVIPLDRLEIKRQFMEFLSP